MQIRVILGFCSLLAAFSAQAGDADLSPSKVFELASPSIVVVQARNKSGTVMEMGSGVVISNGVVVSNCHVFTSAATATATIQYKQKRLPAVLLFSDTEHDLCSFTVEGLTAPPVQMGSTSQLKVGEQAFAIGAPEGLDLTLSGGLISSLRHIPGGVVLQVTTPISPGSSGGGLFDDHARLIGITAYYMKEGQQLNFALPVEWVSELPLRSKQHKTITSQPQANIAEVEKPSGAQQGYRAIVAGNYAKALEVLRPLAERGNANAEAWLGALYADGTGVPQDYRQAMGWLGKAADAGSVCGLTGLGAMYERGEGVAPDATMAYALYNLSAGRRSSECSQTMSLRTKLSRTMTAAQIKTGQEMTRDMQQVGVLIELGLTRPSPSASAAIWNRYLGTIVQNNLQDATANQVYAYMVTAGDSEESRAQNVRQLEGVKDTVSRGAVPGVLLAFGGPNSAATADLIVAAFTKAKPNTFSGVIILFIGDQIDELRVQHSIAKTGAIFRFAEMK